jgi:SAM-dependent methyltransferase
VPLAVGDGIDVPGEAWSFAGPVADHFDAHVARSVPQYAAGHRIIAALSGHFLPPGGTLYDVGCSTGALLAALDDTHRGRDVHLIGVDAEPDMVRAARRRFTDRADISVVQADVRTLEWRPADVIVAHYCVQFTPPVDRPALLAAMHAALRPGGRLLVADYGKQSGLMRLLFRQTIQRLDGVEDTQPNADGVLPQIMAEAGFSAVREARHVATVTGRITLFTAQRG